MDDSQPESQNVTFETPRDNVFVPPSIHRSDLLIGRSYAHYTSIPSILVPPDATGPLPTPCVLGVDEAGRGPVLGPMVYGLLYLPLSQHRSLLADTHHFDDSKVLTPTFRSSLMSSLCTPSSELHSSCGWAVKVMSARDISAGMLKAEGAYNLNAQAMDATVELIKGVFAQGINVTEIYIDTIGSPQVYQTKLARIFPTVSITVAKKADSLYPCVSAASVCAKVTRDAALEMCAETYKSDAGTGLDEEPGWGSGYPSDARCSNWLKANKDPIFGWGNECRFSWSTAKDLLEMGDEIVKVDWPAPDDDEGMQLTQFFTSKIEGGSKADKDKAELAHWFGSRVAAEAF